ncbi:MAG: hypothetical protein ACKV2V_27310, partial [Blastocatellia bacterium]
AIIFVSGYNYTPANAPTGTVDNKDFNGEIFFHRLGDDANTVTQVTNTKATDVLAGTGSVNQLTIAARHINNDGSLITFESSGDLISGKNSDKSREVFVYNTTTKVFTQITDQKLPATPTQDDLNKVDLNFLPNINGAGTFVTFGSIRELRDLNAANVDGFTNNSDGSREIIRVNISNPASLVFRQLTFTGTAARFLDQRENTPVSWVNDAGNMVTYSTSSDVTGTNSDRTFEIFQTLIRPITSISSDAATLVNAASFAPAPAEPAGSLPTVARGATGAIFGARLASAGFGARSANLPYELGGVTVTLGGVAAKLIFVSPGQINFQVPPGVPAGDSVEFAVLNNGVLTLGKVKIADTAPALFTVSSNGVGPAAASCLSVITVEEVQSAVSTAPPCAISVEGTPRFLILYGTGWRNGTAGSIAVTVQKGDETAVSLTVSYAAAQPDFAQAGLDQLNIDLPAELMISGVLKLSVIDAAGVTSQASVTIEIKPPPTTP